MTQKMNGNKHVTEVVSGLRSHLRNSPLIMSATTSITVEKILSIFDNIVTVQSKVDTNNDSMSDVVLYLSDNSSVNINLFTIKGHSRIQPKNLGAKSFLEKYFLSKELQRQFNEIMNHHYEQYINEVTKLLNINSSYLSESRKLIKQRTKGNSIYSNTLKEPRGKLLYNLRNVTFDLLRKSFNNRNSGLLNAYNTLLMTNDINLVTRSFSNRPPTVEEFKAEQPNFDELQVFTKNNDSVGIAFGKLALILRFKFESDPSSSVKLAVSYEEATNKQSIKDRNSETLLAIEKIIQSHTPTKSTNNSIGKCHEVFSYYYLLKAFPEINQVNSESSIKQLEKYINGVSSKTLQSLFNSTASIVAPLINLYNRKYLNYEVKSIELVPDAYVKDKLDTSDIQLILRSQSKIKVSPLSLKAASNSNIKLTAKNPGIGSILGKNYFNVGDLKSQVKEVKELYELGELNHTESLERVSDHLGEKLLNCEQHLLRAGTEKILGTALVVATFYSKNYSLVKEPSKISEDIKVLKSSPSKKQTTLQWSDESLSLRVKFSRGVDHGWSSIKLACEHHISAD